MARVRFEVQGREVFRTRLRVRVDDVNYGGHLGNDSVLTLCHEARIRFFEKEGQSEMNLFGKAIIMTDAMIHYRAEGNRGDDIEITLHNVNDGYVEEMESKALRLVSVQYYPVSPGFDEINDVFTRFLDMIEK